MAKETKKVNQEVKETVAAVEEAVVEKIEEVKKAVEEKEEEVKEAVAEKKTTGRRGRRPKAEAEKEKTTPVKTPAKRGRKPAAEKAAKEEVKAVAKESDASVVLQLSFGEYGIAELVEQCKAAYLAENKAKIKNIDVYVKPADKKAYYVVNDKAAGSVDL